MSTTYLYECRGWDMNSELRKLFIQLNINKVIVYNFDINILIIGRGDTC